MTDTATPPEFAALPDKARAFLLDLLDTPAPSGFEGPASAVWTSHARSVGLETRVDAIGSSFAVANEGARKRVALVGHLDEIGLIVHEDRRQGLPANHEHRRRECLSLHRDGNR